MEQNEFQLGLFGIVDSLYNEFGHRLSLEELLVFAAITLETGIDAPTIAHRTQLSPNRVARALDHLVAIRGLAKRRLGLVNWYTTEERPNHRRYSLSTRGALLSRSLFLKFRHDAIEGDQQNDVESSRVQ